MAKVQSQLSEPSVSPMHLSAISSSNTNLASDSILQITNLKEDAINPTNKKHELKIFRYDLLVAQLIQILCVIFSLGVVFPPLAVLGCIALVSHSYFIQFTVRRFLMLLQTTPAQAGAPLPQATMRSLLLVECELFYLCLRRCLWVPIAASYPVLSFFLFEIVGMSYVYQPQDTMWLPLFFLLLGWASWQLLRLKKVKRWVYGYDNLDRAPAAIKLESQVPTHVIAPEVKGEAMT